MKVFPLWAKVLGRPEIVMEDMDLKIHDSAQAYRAAVAQIKYNKLSLGALVTTHKIDLFEATRDLFYFTDPNAQICGEVSSISKREGRLEGHAKDPITAGLSMDTILGEAYFERTGGTVLCFGAGGSAVATLLHLINKQLSGDRPKRFMMVNRSPEHLVRARHMVECINTDIQVEYICNQDPLQNDYLMGTLTAGSVVINAIGMGKDTPGPPITDAGIFPYSGVAWEFNYRGELDFMHQALAQQASRHLQGRMGGFTFSMAGRKLWHRYCMWSLTRNDLKTLKQQLKAWGLLARIKTKVAWVKHRRKTRLKQGSPLVDWSCCLWLALHVTDCELEGLCFSAQ